MRTWRLVVAFVAVPAVAQAEPSPLELGGFVGADFLPSSVELGNSWAADQVPGSGPSVGGRLAWWLLPHVAGEADSVALDLGVEAEAQISMSSTSGNAAAGRGSYASPVMGIGAHLIAALETGTPVTPHLLAGGGGNAVFTRSPFARDDLDPIGYWGMGVTWWVSDRLAVRVDARHGVEAGRMNDVVSTFMADVGLSTTLGGEEPGALPHVEVGEHTSPPPDHPVPPPDHPVPPPDHPIVPVVADRDHDGVPDDADQCPDQAEDKDGFADTDGCPDPDNDGDGVADAADKCPDQAETLNGIDDGDGCPDTVPDALAAIERLPASALGFDAAKAKIKPAAAKALDDVAATLRKFPAVRVRVESRAGKGVNDDLARRRGDAVRWHLVDSGVAADRIDTVSLPADAKGARVELHLAAGAKP